MNETFDLLRKEFNEHATPVSSIYDHELVVTTRDINQVLDLAQHLWKNRQPQRTLTENPGNTPSVFDWLREQTINVWKLKENPYDSYWNRAMYLEIKKENDKKEEAMRKMQEIIDEAEAKWEATKNELRASVIDEFAEKAKRDFVDYDTYLILHSNGLLNPQESVEYYCYMIDDFARDLKGEKTLSFNEFTATKKGIEHNGIEHDRSRSVEDIER